MKQKLSGNAYSRIATLHISISAPPKISLANFYGNELLNVSSLRSKILKEFFAS